MDSPFCPEEHISNFMMYSGQQVQKKKKKFPKLCQKINKINIATVITIKSLVECLHGKI